ncbi:MAG: type II 3-dehydroquinate dehydratase [Pelagibacteraceae bacterium]|nr:type II 3-dehydroquinate dehydratase [Pelagibacteraceae bacterium]PPR51573.1 MAG: 3-dehydroquinate dehydratase [Alphaproteobacteria bacterium MarineAlpha5_Bin10]|tara:strand:+ start:1092 stop:1538 length:447 start_codon:yes stop_codon:yes gene_type:complete
MKEVLLINGPNLNLLGKREVDVYGETDLEEIKNKSIEKGNLLKIKIDFRQTNSEGEIINWIHEVNEKFDGLIMNPAGYTHTSISILDSLKSVKKPKVELHLSNIYNREEYRKKSLTSEGVHGIISGFGVNSYILAIEAINELIKNSIR